MGIIKKIQRRVGRKWSDTTSDLVGMLGGYEALFRGARGARMLLYHGVCTGDHTRFNSLFLAIRTFEKHLQFYKEYFNVVTLEDYYQGKFSEDRFNVCLTFDDGFANNHHYVLPLMERYKMPMAFFITGIREAGGDILWNDLLSIFQKYGPQEWMFREVHYYKGAGRRYLSTVDGGELRELLQSGGFSLKEEFTLALGPLLPSVKRAGEADYWMQMTTHEIRNLSASPLATIGCHGYYHNDLSRLSAEAVRDELIRNKRYLEETTGRSVAALAFPYGNYTEATIATVVECGFTRLLATDFLFPEDCLHPAMRERMTVNPYISVNNQMKAIIHGQY